MTAVQGTLDADVGLCRVGLPKMGERRRCSLPATHVACWKDRKGSGRIECCREHADYYASQWAYVALVIYHLDDTIWIEILP